MKNLLKFVKGNSLKVMAGIGALGLLLIGAMVAPSEPEEAKEEIDLKPEDYEEVDNEI